MKTIFASFIIPHRNRYEFLLATVASIAALNLEGSHVEIIVVTQETGLDGLRLACQVEEKSGRTLAFHEVSSMACAPPAMNKANVGSLTLKVLRMPSSATISALRNFGVKHSGGDYLAFIDADVELSPGWLTAMRVALATRPQRVMVSAMQIEPAKANTLERIRVSLSNVKVDANLEFLPGRNLFLERRIFDALGGFPEHLITCEDYWFTNRACQIGELYYSSAASYLHLGEDKTYRGMAIKEVWRGQSNLYSLEGRRITLRESASFIVPLWMLLAVSALIPGTVFFGIWGFTMLAMAILLPAGLYSWRIYYNSVQKLPIVAVFGFYLLYLPSRGLGMLMGVVKVLAMRTNRKSFVQ